MTIRVVSIISRMNVGGPATLMEGLIVGLRNSEFEHHLIIGRCADNEIDFIDINPELATMVHVHKIESLGRAVNPIADLKSFLILRKLLQNLQPDVIHTHTSKAGLLGRLAAITSKSKAKIVHTFHGHLLYGYFSPFKTKLIVWTESCLAKKTDKLVAVTDLIRRDLLASGIGQLSAWTVIHPGVPQSKLKNSPSTKNRILWIGRFTDIKNPGLAIEIFSILSSQIPVSLTMVGGGELLSILQKKCSAENLNVDFQGWKSNVYSSLQNADALLMTSKNEGLPLAMLEAASLGVPTFSTAVGGVPEFIDDGSTGFLIEAEALAASRRIFEMLSRKTQLKKVGVEAKKLFELQFTMDGYVNSHLELYKELTS